MAISIKCVNYGQGDLTYDDLAAIFAASRHDGTFGLTMHDWPEDEVNEVEFVSTLRRFPLTVGLQSDGQWAGYVYVTEFEGQSGRVHFGVCGPAKGDRALCVELGRAALGWIFENVRTTPGGSKHKHELMSLVGAVPMCNGGALALAHAVGGRQASIIPGLCYFARGDRCHDGAIFIFRRGDYGRF